MRCDICRGSSLTAKGFPLLLLFPILLSCLWALPVQAFDLLVFVRDARSGKLLEGARVELFGYRESDGEWELLLEGPTTDNGCLYALNLQCRRVFIKASMKRYLTGFYPGRLAFQPPEFLDIPYSSADFGMKVVVDLEPTWKEESSSGRTSRLEDARKELPVPESQGMPVRVSQVGVASSQSLPPRHPGR